MINLSENGLRSHHSFSEDFSPMENIANLVDAMLVFACGLLLALVTFWNLELPDVTKVMKDKEITEVSDVEEIIDQVDAEGSTYNELGMVYEDPETGTMYLIQDDSEGSEESAGGEEE